MMKCYGFGLHYKNKPDEDNIMKLQNISKETEMTLYVVTHKEITEYPTDRTLIGVGENQHAIHVSCYDDNGENISNKNPHYCELTALYWIWKHDTSQIVGLEHYRRFFYKKSCINCRVLTKEDILRILKKGKIILARPERSRATVERFYRKSHYISDLMACRATIEKQFPQYVSDFDAVMKKRMWSVSMCNMFVMPKVMADEYCAWLFPVLFEVEKQIDIGDRDVYQQRVFGFLAERLFNVWLHHRRVKVYHARIGDIHYRPIQEDVRRFFQVWGRRVKKLFCLNK